LALQYKSNPLCVVGSTALYQKQREAAPTIQHAARCYLAMEELWCRKLIIQLFNQVNKKKSQKEEKQVQDWTAIGKDKKEESP
jgi:hypothetical protein